MNKWRLSGRFCLLVYLLVWVGNTQAMPLMLVSISHTHKIFLTYRDDKIQITLHHPGNGDQHEPAPTLPVGDHTPALLDQILLVLSKREDPSDADHILQIPLNKPAFLAAKHKSENKAPKLATAFVSQPITPSLPSVAVFICVSFLGPSPPDVPSIPPHLRTTVLLN